MTSDRNQSRWIESTGCFARMPKLDVGRIYFRGDVEPYIAKQISPIGESDDFLLVERTRFPVDFQTGTLDLARCRIREPIAVRYEELPSSSFGDQINRIEVLMQPRPESEEKIQEIMRLLQNGEFLFPFYIQKEDPNKYILEGNHRAVAFHRLRFPTFPVFVVGYADWFPGT